MTLHTSSSRRYMTGFANEFATEAVANALPVGRNSPQIAPLGLYAEQLSGTAFTAPRHSNRRSWPRLCGNTFLLKQLSSRHHPASTLNGAS